LRNINETIKKQQEKISDLTSSLSNIDWELTRLRKKHSRDVKCFTDKIVEIDKEKRECCIDRHIKINIKKNTCCIDKDINSKKKDGLKYK
jgi:hypothetical protein